MAEYIEKQVAIDALHEAYEARNPTQNAIMDKATMVIFRLPPADVRPVKSGRWVYGIVRADIPIPLECSACEWQVTRRTNFCPNCGADMRGGDADGEEKD